MFTELLVAHCAPTLAAIKPGSLFSLRCLPGTAHLQAAYWTARLAGRGIRIRALRAGGGRALMYVYRPALLRAVLGEGETAAFLGGYGYHVDGTNDLRAVLRHLHARTRMGDGFPHEIGVFLGYPLADVRGFIAHGGQNYKHCGFWKVYGDERQARVLFARYTACTKEYRALFQHGLAVTQLAALT